MRLRMAFLSVILLAMAGCQTGNKQPISSAPSPAPVIASNQEREAIQFKAAEVIDVTVKGTSVETPVKAETAKIVKANQSAPASGIETLVKAYEATIEGRPRKLRSYPSRLSH